MNILEALFSTNAKSQIIQRFFVDGLPEYYTRELERLTEVDIKTLHSELRKLLEVDLLESRKDGNRLYFKAKASHPLCPTLIELIKKSIGPEKRLREIFKNNEEINFSFIFGSYIKGDFKASSDIDLFCVGSITSLKLTDLLYDLQGEIGREINFHLYDETELYKAIKEKKHFILSLKTTPKLFVKGSENDFKQLFKRKRN